MVQNPQGTTEEQAKETGKSATEASAGPQEEAQQEKMSVTPQESKEGEMERAPEAPLGPAELFTSPYSLMQRMMTEMDRKFSRFGLGGGILPMTAEAMWSPAIETFERNGRLVLHAELPGLEPGNVKVEVVGDELVISGRRKHEEEKRSRGRYYSERSYGSFERRIALPEKIDAEDIDATYENGVLEVSLKLPEEKPKSRTVAVRSGRGEIPPRSVH